MEDYSSNDSLINSSNMNSSNEIQDMIIRESAQVERNEILTNLKNEYIDKSIYKV